MNKYQEALLELGKYTVVISWSKNQTCSINELNEFKLLQELVDKATPKKETLIILLSELLENVEDVKDYIICEFEGEEREDYLHTITNLENAINFITNFLKIF